MPDLLDLITHVVLSANNIFVGTDESFTCRTIISRHWTASFLEMLVARRYAEYREACDARENW